MSETTSAVSDVDGHRSFTKSRQPRQIAVLVAFVLVGAAALGLWQSYLELLHGRQQIENHTLERAIASALVVDRETSAAAHLLQSLAMSPALSRGDLAAFYEQMLAAAPGGTWLILHDA